MAVEQTTKIARTDMGRYAGFISAFFHTDAFAVSVDVYGWIDAGKTALPCVSGDLPVRALRQLRVSEKRSCLRRGLPAYSLQRRASKRAYPTMRWKNDKRKVAQDAHLFARNLRTTFSSPLRPLLLFQKSRRESPTSQAPFLRAEMPHAPSSCLEKQVT